MYNKINNETKKTYLFIILFIISFMEWAVSLTDEEFKKCRLFAEKSAKTQREKRSGGKKIREFKFKPRPTARIALIKKRTTKRKKVRSPSRISWELRHRG